MSALRKWIKLRENVDTLSISKTWRVDCLIVQPSPPVSRLALYVHSLGTIVECRVSTTTEAANARAVSTTRTISSQGAADGLTYWTYTGGMIRFPDPVVRHLVPATSAVDVYRIPTTLT